jgi:hypothetical protein
MANFTILQTVLQASTLATEWATAWAADTMAALQIGGKT